MVAANGIHSNGTNGHFLNCASDYEERPLIDITPAPAPKPGWRDQFPAFTHNLSWVDADGCSQSMTLRSDSLSDLMRDLKLLKAMIKQAKESAKAQVPGDSQAPTVEPDSDVPPCKIHNMAMERRVSKRTGGIYFSHRMPGTKDLCFGRAPKA